MVRFWQILVLAVVVVSCESLPTLSVDKEFSQNFVKFEDFRRDFGKSYSSAKEALKRFQIFTKNLAKIDHLNEVEEGTARYGINEMADWTEEEFLTRRANLNGAKLMESLKSAEFVTFRDNDTVPDSKNWTAEGKVAPVKNQGQCGSCWAFSTTGCVESCNAIKSNDTGNGTMQTMAEQQLVDCDTESNQGCNGGWPDDAIDYFIENGAMSSESYPYTAKDGTCKYSKDDVVGTVTKRVNIPSKDEKAMKSFVGSMGPLSVAINAAKLQYYESGIVNPSMVMCNPMRLDHAVLVVGYNTTTVRRRRRPTDYWIIKNSWGPTWGENGFARVARGSNTCGIAMAPAGVQC